MPTHVSELDLPMPSYSLNNNNSNNNSLRNSSLDWDHFHGLGVFNKDTMSLVMEGKSTVPFFSPLGSEGEEDDDFSTGYLEDALIEFSERSKRRRLLLLSDEDQIMMKDSANFLHKGFWNSSNWELSENFSFMSHMTTFNELSGWPMTTSICSMGEEENMMATEMKTPEEEKSISEIIDSSSSSCKDSAETKSIVSEKKLTPFSVDLPGWEKSRIKKRTEVITRVVYPFAVVKPGGKEGDVTLNDINERILMPPTRPVRHPVGDFACQPCVSPHGPGLSGKAVVALTRIHTQGRGTITIIRTKG